MAIQGIAQPDIIVINDILRLRKFDGHFDFAYQWYQDKETVRLVDGENADTYDMDKLLRMYKYLESHGELYFIEVHEENEFVPVGDVAFWQEDMPIVIGDKRYRKRGIGNHVIKAMIQRATELGYKTIYINEIYSYNEGSRLLFEKNGFQAYKITDRGAGYKLDL